MHMYVHMYIHTYIHTYIHNFVLTRLCMYDIPKTFIGIILQPHGLLGAYKDTFTCININDKNPMC